MKTSESNVLENLLVWSAARAKALGTCNRKYFYNFVGSWEGWDTNSPPEVQAAYRVKHLSSPDLELGQIIHDQIRTILGEARAGRAINQKMEILTAQERFINFLECSERRQLAELTAKRRKLFLHEMGKTLSPKELAAYVGKIEDHLTGFFAFDDVKSLLANPSCLIPNLLDPPGFDIGDELGVPSRPRTDAVFSAAGVTVICDWKCGAPNAEHRTIQGAVYDIFVRNKLSLAPSEKVEVRFYYLPTREVVSHVFTEEERVEKLWQIGEEFEGMKCLSDDPRINIGPESRFPARVSRSCFGCNHRLLCPEFLASKLNSVT